MAIDNCSHKRVVCDFKPRKSASHSPLHRRVLFNRLTIPAPPPRRPRSRFLSRFLSRFSFAAARTRFLFYAVCDFSCQRASNPPVSICQSQTAVASGESSATTRSACKQSCQQACDSGPLKGYPPAVRLSRSGRYAWCLRRFARLQLCSQAPLRLIDGQFSLRGDCQWCWQSRSLFVASHERSATTRGWGVAIEPRHPAAP